MNLKDNITLQKRINIFSQVIATILKIFGALFAIIQLIKISPLLEYYSGWTFTWSNIAGFILGLVIFYLAKKQKISQITYSLISTKSLKIKFFIFSLPLVILLLIIGIKVVLGHDSREYIMLNTEGGLIEYGTSLFYLLAFAFSLPVAKSLCKTKPRIVGIGYYLLAFAFLIVCLEEISWGQRLLGWQSPEFFNQFNSQQETTIHNLEWFRHYLHRVYILIGLLGTFSWLSLPFLKSNKSTQKLVYFIPRWFISSYFLPCVIIFSILEYTQGFNFFISKDQESVELILSLGFFSLAVMNFFQQPLERDGEIERWGDREMGR